jgi:hypothetical protein
MTGILLAFALTPVRAQDIAISFPFQGQFTTRFEVMLQGHTVSLLRVDARGEATAMGKTTAFTDNQYINLVDGSGTATYTLTGANGNSVTLDMILQSINVDGGVTFAGSYTVVGGTGLFERATGSGVLVGGALFTSASEGIGAFALLGTITTIGGQP